MQRLLILTLSCLSSVACHSAGSHDDSSPDISSESIAEFTRGLEHRAGLFEVWLDQEHGRVWLGVGGDEVDGSLPTGGLAECLYVEGLATGLGSNDVGLDRGQIGPTRHVVFRRMGDRLLIEAQNSNFLAASGDADEGRAARESFATSILWSGEIAASEPSGRVLVDLTSFVVRDAHGTASTLQEDGGSWSLDQQRSFLQTDGLLVFPDNIELEALLTFAGKRAGREVREVAPDPSSVTLVQHHSFVRLPDDRYAPRVFDPRAGSFATSHVNVAAHPGEPNVNRLAVRFRLEKQDPGAALSEPVEAIIYHVDRGAPEPIRSALVEGASWWNEAFEAAGYRDAFRVELLPEGAHPLDVRYNVIQWVHRSSRGWSYGGGVQDPRTGEMIKGHVVLGSLRVRQDRLIFEGLLGTGQSGSGRVDDPVQLALARIRQLSAHEVGHTLGLAHNFAASTYDGRASVMDYPAPLVRAGREPDSLDVSAAYGVGIGTWDRLAISHLYAHEESEELLASRLDSLIAQAESEEMVYLSDRDARPAGAADPRGNLWDNGSDPLRELTRVLDVRRIGLSNFGPDRLAEGQPTSLYQDVLIPLFFMHRYQVEAVAKMIGGRWYEHSLVGDGRAAPEVVPATRQRLALQLLLESLATTSEVPSHVTALLVPQTIVAGRRREAFVGRASPMFDPVAMGEASMRFTLLAILQPERLERVAQQHDRDPSQLGLSELFGELVEEVKVDALLSTTPSRDALARVLVGELISLARTPRASGRVRGASEEALWMLREHWRKDRGREGAAARHLLPVIERFSARPHDREEPAPLPSALPPGSPIGCSQG